ncbi:MAG: zinc ABC transporter substrate-binding protein [Candidatus Aminicenantes bacterium]|nr:zinc ABC transporter substrate-binding protein [Candidatus Aminicenantes bacterium]
MKKIKAVATVFPLMEFAQAVIGDRGEVELLLPPGAEIHAWQPRPSDILKISDADLFMCIGVDLEPWVQGVLDSVHRPMLRVFRASDGMKLIKEPIHNHERKFEDDHEHDHSGTDPHIWLDFNLDQHIIDNLVRMLSEIRPKEESFFVSNGREYKNKLRQLDQKYQKTLSQCQKKTFVVGGHAAFGYLAKRYGLQQVSLYGLNPEARPSPRQLVEVVEMSKKHDIRVIYFEINVSDDLAKVIAKEIGARTMALNPAANRSRKQLRTGTTFIEIMEMNLKNLCEGLSCE